MGYVLLIVFCLLVLAWGYVQNYCSRYDKVLSWAVVQTQGDQFTKREMNVLRAALAPKSYLTAINYQFGLPVAILALGTYINWYLGIAGLLVSNMVVYGLLSRFMSGTVEAYLIAIVNGLHHKAADYQRGGDELRYSAAVETAQPLEELYEKVRGKNLRIPSSGVISYDYRPYNMWR